MELLLLGAGTAFLVYKNRKRNFEKNLSDFYISVDHGEVKGINHSIGDDYIPFITLDSAYFTPSAGGLSDTEKTWPSSWFDIKKVIFKRLEKINSNWNICTKSDEDRNITAKIFTVYRSKRFRIDVKCVRIDMSRIFKNTTSTNKFHFAMDEINIFCKM